MKSNRQRALKWLCYTLCLLLVLILQESVFSRLPLFNAFPVPVPALVAIVAAMEGSTGSVVFALCAGILTDSLSGSAGFYTLILTVLSAVTVFITDGFFRRGRGLSLVISVCFVFITELLRVFTHLIYSRVGISAFWTVVPAELLYTFILTLPMLPLLSSVNTKFKEKRGG